MTSDATPPTIPPALHSLGASLHELRKKWGWIVGLGVIFVAAGMFAFGSVVSATIVSVVFVGSMMLVAGVAEIFAAFQMKSWGKFLMWLALGAAYVLAGVVTIGNPLLAAASLTLLLAFSLIIGGGVRVYLALNLKETAPWIAVLVSGVITLLLGVTILAKWPVDSLFVLGTFLAIDLMVAGLGWIAIGMKLREGYRAQGKQG